MSARVSQRVLWLDNDPGYVYPFQVALTESGMIAQVAPTVTEAEEALAKGTFDLVIIDVMVPVTADEADNHGYTGDVTDDSHKTGLEFYKRWRDRLTKAGTAAAIMTVRVDKTIRDEFIAAGLPAKRFIMKMELRDAPTFVARVRQLIAEGCM